MNEKKDAVLNLRVPKRVKASYASFANVTGMSLNELVNWFLEYGIYQDTQGTLDRVRALAVARMGQDMADRRMKLEAARLRMIVDGFADETEDGSFSPLTREELDKRFPDTEPIYEAVERDAVAT